MMTFVSFIVPIIAAMIVSYFRYTLRDRSVKVGISKLTIEIFIGMMVVFAMAVFACSGNATQVAHYYNARFGAFIAYILLFIVIMIYAGIMWLLLSFIVRLVSGLRRLSLEEKAERLRTQV